MKFNFKIEKLFIENNSEQITDTEGRKYLDYIKNDNKEFFRKFDISKLAQETVNRSRESHRKIISLITVPVLVAASLIIGLSWQNRLTLDREKIILKGSDTLNIYLKENNIITRLKNRDSVKNSDKLQITYISSNKYGVIFSIDGLNNITYHFPQNYNDSMELKKEESLPSSYTLDNAPDFEKFYFITNNRYIDPAIIKEATDKINIVNGRILSDLKLPKEYNIYSLTLIKEQ